MVKTVMINYITQSIFKVTFKSIFRQASRYTDSEEKEINHYR